MGGEFIYFIVAVLAATVRRTHAWSVSRDILGYCSCDVGYCSCDGMGTPGPEPGAAAAADGYDLSTDIAYACYCAAVSTFYVGLPLLALAALLLISWRWFSEGGRKAAVRCWSGANAGSARGR